MRKGILFTVACCFVAALAPARIQAEDEGTKILYVKGNELFVASELGEARQLTRDGARKSLPVWSKEGSTIAFIEGADGERALGNVVVIDGEGRTVSSISFRNAADSVGGMRFIESLEWLAPNRIAVSGSVNPSLMETAVIV